MPGSGDGEIEALAAIAGLILAALAVTRNGVRLPDILTTAMSSSLAADGLQPEDVEVDNLSFMLEAARESYESQQGKALPKYIEGKVKRWVKGGALKPRSLMWRGHEVPLPQRQTSAQSERRTARLPR